MTQLIARSHSALNTFETCPHKFEAEKVLKIVPYVENEYAKWGNYVHTCLENYIKNGAPLPSNVQQYQKFADAILGMARKHGDYELIVEREIAITAQWELVSWFDRSAYFRIKIDVLVLLPNGVAMIFDWKTGKPKEDPLQLMLYALFVFKLWPHIHTCNVGNVWLAEDRADRPVTFTRAQDMDRLMDNYVQRNTALSQAFTAGVYPKKKNGLCRGWCDHTKCEYWEPKPARRR